MSITPKISEAEWEIMKIIWEHHQLTSEQITRLLPASVEWSEQTVRTFV
ncbi:transcriptional regulator, partial [Paenibacillus sp. FSL R7-0333]